MVIHYEDKKPEQAILEDTPPSSLECIANKGDSNKLIHAENLSALKTLLSTHKGAIDLIYIDPPFATNTDFTISDHRSNTISRSSSGISAYSDKLTGPEYLEFLRHRLVFLRELLSETGSIYLHIDYKVGHYVKLIMDEIFGVANFRNDITRIKCNPKNFARKAYGNIKDMILFYSKSSDITWNNPSAPFTERDINRLFKKISKDGRRYTTIPLHAPGETVNGKTSKKWKGINPPEGRHWRTDPAVLEQWDKEGLIEWSNNGVPRKKIFLDERDGKKVQDIWEFKDPQYPLYPTEKNLDLLRFILEASSNEGDTVLDCFVGSGTTLVAAEMLGRHWIGIDQSESAVQITRERLATMPRTLFSTNNYEFWQEEKITGQPQNIKRGSMEQAINLPMAQKNSLKK